MQEKISFCIPCYRSEDTISQVIEEIASVMDSKKDKYEYEIVCVIDGSPDNVYHVLKNIATDNDKIKVVDLARNFGQAGARMATLKYATGDYLVCLDDDGQCPMNHFWELFEPIEKGMDVAIAKYPKKEQSLFKNFGSNINKITMRSLLDVDKDFKMSNFFIIRKYVSKKILEYTNPYPFMTGLITRTTKNIALVEMEDRKRISGKTGYTLKKLISHWLNGFTAFSIKPLRFSSLIGVICAVMGFLFGVITIIRKLIDPSIVAGYSSTIAILLFIGGLIMLMLGMIGEYLGRIYISINNSPQYVVRETINIDKETNNE